MDGAILCIAGCFGVRGVPTGEDQTAGAVRFPRRAGRAGTVLQCVLLLLVVWTKPAAALDDWQFQVGATTDNTTRGIDFSDGKPSAFAMATWYPGNGFLAGFSVSTTRSPGRSETGMEAVTNAGYVWRAGGQWSAQVMLVDYHFVRMRYANRQDYDEIVWTGGWRDMLYASVSISPNVGIGASPKSLAISSDLVARVPLTHGFSAKAGIGYGDTKAEIGSGIVYGDAGLTYQYRSMQFDLMYVATHVSAELRAKTGNLLLNRWVADAILHF